MELSGLFISDGQYIVEAYGNVDSLNFAVDLLQEKISCEEAIEHYDGFSFPAYKIPSGVSFDALKNVLGDRLHHKAINGATYQYKDETPVPVEYVRELSETDRLHAYMKADKIEQEISSLNRQEMQLKALIKQKRAKLEAELEAYKDEARTGRAERKAMCRRRLNFDTGETQMMTADGTIIETRPMTPVESQMNFTNVYEVAEFTLEDDEPFEEEVEDNGVDLDEAIASFQDDLGTIDDVIDDIEDDASEEDTESVEDDEDDPYTDSVFNSNEDAF